YIDIIKRVYYVQEILPESEKIKCNYCNKKFKGAIVYKQGKNNSMIKYIDHIICFKELSRKSM
ncbi:MAG: hypothetical protein SOV90_00745, partial [Lachnospiraceae bacterium]|nr:hypothetical protein [Lachnospiraceae bacterium]